METARRGTLTSERPSAVRLRGHHLLCVLGFRGHGYSPAFTRNLAAIVRRLSDSDPPVRIAAGADDICAQYPPNEDPHCDEARVTQRDRRVLERLKLHPGEILSWSELSARIASVFVPEDLDTLCATCSWLPLGYCRDGVAALRRAGNSRTCGETIPKNQLD